MSTGAAIGEAATGLLRMTAAGQVEEAFARFAGPGFVHHILKKGKRPG